MSELEDLYREVILDHNKNPRNFAELDDADRTIEGVNPLCGDKLTLYVKLDGDRIADIGFKGTGCAISVASSSMMTERVKGATIDEGLQLFDTVHRMLAESELDETALMELGKLAALSGVREYPSRVKCASLAWHALKTALNDSTESVSTE